MALRDTMREFCGRPMCPTCKERLHDQPKGGLMSEIQAERLTPKI